MKLTVHLVTWNGAKYIPYLFDSLKKQEYTDWKLFVLDNGSEDDTVELVKQELTDVPFDFELFESDNNKGFTAGHNELLGRSDSEYFLMLNQDMVVEPNCLDTLVRFMDSTATAATVSPRLMRWRFQEVEAGHLENSFTDYIDTMGLKVLRSRRVVEYLTGERWAKDSLCREVVELLDRPHIETFGVSGALPFCRRSAIDAVLFSDGTFLDETYHSYKEDVDLAFRLRQVGYRSFVIPGIVAYHDRSAAGAHGLGDRAAVQNKQTQTTWTKYHSYKNHLSTMVKNEYWQNFLLDFPWIAWYEIKKFGHFLLFDRSVLKGLFELIHLRESLKDKRSSILKYRKASWRDMRAWWRSV